MAIAILVLNCCIFLIGLYTIFFKSYFTEKGKNLATKRDIEEITTKVESIKVQFIKETELLRYSLQFETQVSLSYHNDMKNAIVELYEIYSLWLTTLSECEDNSIEFNTKRINESEQELDKIYTKFLLAESKAELYVSDDNFFKTLYSLKSLTLELNNLTEDYLLDLCSITEDIEDLEKDEDENDIDYTEELNKKEDERSQLYKKFHQSVIDINRKIREQHLAFGDNCRNLLKKTHRS